MASSEDFKRAIREGRLHDALIVAITKAPELNITTWIASAETSSEQPEAGKFLRTNINLVEGEITNKIGAAIIEDSLYQKAQQFHNQQISQGHQTISHNLESLQRILRLTTILEKQKRGETYQPLKPFKISSLPEANAFTVPQTQVISESTNINPITILNDEEPLEDNMLSLGDLEAEADKITDTLNAKDEDNDWGDWLEEDNNNLDLDTDILTLDAFELEESEEWEDETEFLPSSETNPPKKDDNQ